MLKVARKRGEKAFAPNVENTQSGDYPISRPLYIYTRGESTDAVKKYLAWIETEAGQRLVLSSGYVPSTQGKGAGKQGVE